MTVKDLITELLNHGDMGDNVYINVMGENGEFVLYSLDGLENTLAAQAPSKDALEWQPIKTAPKDGTEMLLFNDKKKYLANGCFGQKGHEYANPNVWVWPYINLEPTHWMTLPRAPINAHEVK